MGSVAFVGAGPGDPGLLTLRAVEVLRRGRRRRRSRAPAHRALLAHAPDDVEVVDGGVGDDGQPLPAPCAAKLVRRGRQGAAQRRPAARRRPVPAPDRSPRRRPPAPRPASPFEVVPGCRRCDRRPGLRRRAADRWAQAQRPASSTSPRQGRLARLHGRRRSSCSRASTTELGRRRRARWSRPGAAPGTPVAVTAGGTHRRPAHRRRPRWSG